MAIPGYLGIDAGTQGLSVVFTDEALRVLATAESGYAMCPGLEDGCYEQLPDDWFVALTTAMTALKKELDAGGPWQVLGIGISAQMHGEVLVGDNDQPLQAARLWCDARNESEGLELTEALGVKMPKRITAARWLWTCRQRPALSAQVKHLTTPGGWLAFCLTGQWNLGIGDAAGMFPIDPETLDYDQRLLDRFDALVPKSAMPIAGLRDLLPRVRVAGDDGGVLTEAAATQLGLVAGIPVAPAEGDQPASLAGSLIGDAGMVSVSFGTSVCANSVGNQRFEGVSQAVDHFCAPDGKPINMVWLRNGTTFMNTLVEMFADAMGGDRGDAFARIMPQVLDAAPDCGGLLALPFMDDEPGLGIDRGGSAQLFGINLGNATPANSVKAALLATMFNLKLGCRVLDQQGFPRTELRLSGGLTRTPELGQILADVLETPVVIPTAADEGCAWGAALLASYRVKRRAGSAESWSAFLNAQPSQPPLRFLPDPDRVQQYNRVFQAYQQRFNANRD